MDEEAINSMSFIFFDEVLSELNHKLTYNAIANYAGNSFMEKSWDMIMEHHPLLAKAADGPQTTENKALQGLASLFGG